MTDAELIARLRDPNRDWPEFGHDRREAKDRIEELVKELQETQDRANAFATKEYYTEMRAEHAEAKLTKAVEALQRIAEHPYCWHTLARKTLAELEGK